MSMRSSIADDAAAEAGGLERVDELSWEPGMNEQKWTLKACHLQWHEQRHCADVHGR